MNIDKFKHQHVQILQCITELRACTRAGIVENAAEIARLVVAMSSVIKLHLAAEDQVLYPALQAGDDRALARLGQRYQDEMLSIATSYMAFARRWNAPHKLQADPEGFRADANLVLKAVYERMRREDRDFYPAIEHAASAQPA